MNWWLLPLGILMLGLTTTLPGLELVVALAAAPIFFHTSNAWWLCFMIALPFTMYVRSKSDFIHTKRQAESLLSGFLSSQSPYVFQEIDVPPTLYEAFPSYAAKQLTREITAKLGRAIGFSKQELSTYKSKSLRAFRFYPRKEDQITAAAVAYPVAHSSSLVFVREDFATLKDVHRFQLYHEVAHGTWEGTEILLRPLRWLVGAFVVRCFMYSSLVAAALLCYRSFNVRTLSCLALLAAAHMTYRSVKRFTLKLSVGASEVMADSIALRHPEFLSGRWKERVQNLTVRLGHELQGMPIDDPRRFSVHFRKGWAERWLRNGAVGPYMYADVNPLLPLAFVLYMGAGALFIIPQAVPHLLFWVLWSVSVVIVPLTLAMIGWKRNQVLMALNASLEARLREARDTQQHSEASGSGASATAN